MRRREKTTIGGGRSCGLEGGGDSFRKSCDEESLRWAMRHGSQWKKGGMESSATWGCSDLKTPSAVEGREGRVL